MILFEKLCPLFADPVWCLDARLRGHDGAQ
jgi:hypothetical protein